MRRFSVSRTRILSALTLLLLMSVFLSGCPRGGVVVHRDGALDGYTLLNVTGANPEMMRTVLIDMEGNVVHVYQASEGHMLPDGSLLGNLYVDPPYFFDATSLLMETWGGDVVWEFDRWEKIPDKGWMCRNHHDWVLEGNPVPYFAPGQAFVEGGSVLVLAHENLTVPEISPAPLLDEIVYEIDYGTRTTTDFFWRASDHYKEFGFDEAALRVIAGMVNPDWLHINSICRLGRNRWYDQNPRDTRFHPDNLIMDSRNAGFIFIIDHETGNVVWRVGPDYSKGNPESALRPIIGQHLAHMIPKGLPGEGNILVFDNGGISGYGGKVLGKFKYYRSYSRVIEFDPVTLKLVWEHTPRKWGHGMDYSTLLGSAQRLPNGNTLITCGNTGRLIEVTPDHKTVWDYRNMQSVYRAFRVPPSWVPKNPAGYDDSWK